MRYIGLALYTEGPSDDRFLRPLLQRLCSHVCAIEAVSPVDFSEVEPLSDAEEDRARPRHERVVQAARRHYGAWQILFVHGDGAGNPVAARAQLVDPAIDALQAAFAGEGLGVAVVPVRETESWALKDGDALRAVFGVTHDDAHLGLPVSARAVEAVLDPKAALAAAFQATQPTGRRKRQGVVSMLNALGEQISLDQLQELPSVRALMTDLRAALRELRVIP